MAYLLHISVAPTAHVEWKQIQYVLLKYHKMKLFFLQQSLKGNWKCKLGWTIVKRSSCQLGGPICHELRVPEPVTVWVVAEHPVRVAPLAARVPGIH